MSEPRTADDLNLAARTRARLEALPPDKRVQAEAALRRLQSPDRKEQEARDREALAREYRETGRIAAAGESLGADQLAAFARLVGSLRAERERRGLSLADVSARSGLDKGFLSRLENGKILNPTISTLWRYAGAVGAHVSFRVEAGPAAAP